MQMRTQAHRRPSRTDQIFHRGNLSLVETYPEASEDSREVQSSTLYALWARHLAEPPGLEYQYSGTGRYKLVVRMLHGMSSIVLLLHPGSLHGAQSGLAQGIPSEQLLQHSLSSPASDSSSPTPTVACAVGFSWLNLVGWAIFWRLFTCRIRDV